MIASFLEHLSAELLRSPATVGAYESDLRSFEAYWQQQDESLTWNDVDEDLVRGWMEQQMDRGNSPSSVARRLSALRALYRYGLMRQMLQRDITLRVESPRSGKRLPYYVREGQMDRLLDTLPPEEGLDGVRSRAIIIMFYETGMRLSELCALNDQDVDLQRCTVRVTGKGSKQRDIPFGTEVRDALQQWQQVRQEEHQQQSPQPLFTEDNGQRVRPQWVRQLVKKELSRVTTMKKRSPHVLRHSYATALLNHGADIETVRRLLGHESVSTTEIYTHTTFEQLKKAYQHAHPRA